MSEYERIQVQLSRISDDYELGLGKRPTLRARYRDLFTREYPELYRYMLMFYFMSAAFFIFSVWKLIGAQETIHAIKWAAAMIAAFIGVIGTKMSFLAETNHRFMLSEIHKIQIMIARNKEEYLDHDGFKKGD